MLLLDLKFQNISYADLVTQIKQMSTD